jgi:hypothetical protein
MPLEMPDFNFMPWRQLLGGSRYCGFGFGFVLAPKRKEPALAGPAPVRLSQLGRGVWLSPEED